MLAPGPTWRSFEQFRTAGTSVGDAIKVGHVATLHTKGVTLRIIRDEDFQSLVGLASEVNRLKRGFRIVLQAAKIVHRYRNDAEAIEMLLQSASMLDESCALPERIGHQQFEIGDGTIEDVEEDVDLSNIPRPTL